MAKLLFVILVNFVVSTSVLFGENICSHYDDKDCVHPNTTKNGHYTNQWSVYMPGVSKDEAKRLLEDNGFDYLGQIIDGLGLYLVTKKGTPEKHAMLDEKTIELLKKHEQVHSVAQKHVIENSADKVFSIVDNSNVECKSLDPSSIKLNDGSENLKRAQEQEGGEAVATMYTTARPASSSGSVDQYDLLNNNNTINSAVDAMMAAEKLNMQREDVMATLMAAMATAASDAAVSSATAIVDSLPPSETNDWMVASDVGPSYGDLSDDVLALREYLLKEYLIQNMNNLSKSRPLRDVNQYQLSEDPMKANLLNGDELFDKLSVDGTTVTGPIDNENMRPEF